MKNPGNPLEKVFSKALEALEALIKIPSVSTRNQELERGAEAVAYWATKFGLKARVVKFKSDSAPFVIAEYSAGNSRRLLFYNHYDVQPEEPVEEWATPPFELRIKDGQLFGRGVADDKGHIVARFASILLILEKYGKLPLDIKFIIEGEEEIGSPNVGDFLEKYREEFYGADGCIWESGGQTFSGQPILYMGMKGVVAVEAIAKGAKIDLHSSLGPIVPNPLWELVDFLTSLKDKKGKILIPGFYDRVKPPTPQDIEAVKKVPDETSEILKNLGLKEFLFGLKGHEALMRLYFEPVININGMYGGYHGPGSKTVIPHKAIAKFDIRLVPDQEPEEIYENLLIFKEKSGFDSIDLRLSGGMEGPARTPINHPFVELVRETAREAYRKEPVLLPLIAGSGPMAHFRKILQVPIVGTGVGHPRSGAHAPNENIYLDHLRLGILHIARVIEKMAGLT